MFFVLSKTLNYLAMPLVWVVALFVLAFVWRNPVWKRRCLVSSFVLLLFFSNDFISNEVMMWWEPDAVPYASMTKHYEWGIVLTGVTSNDREPTDRVYFSHGADRVVHTVDLYKRGIIKKILISGGIGRLVTDARREADELYDVMQLMGVPPEAMVVENESRNTHESAVRIKEMLHNDTSEKLLITSAFHIPRSLACFEKEGVKVDTFSCDFYSHPRYYTLDVLLIPKIDAIMNWQRLFKEWTGMVAYKVAGYS